jgi:hypothetical protein
MIGKLSELLTRFLPPDLLVAIIVACIIALVILGAE